MSVATLPRTRNRQQLLAWVNKQKAAPLSTAQAAALDSVYPDWRKTLNGVWFTNLEAVQAFFAARGFFPRARVQDPAEKTLGIWIATQRYRADLLSDDRAELLDTRLPGWNKSKEDAWNERLDEVCAIAAALGRIPTAIEDDTEARRAGVWLRKYSKAPAADPAVMTLNDRIPGWNDRGLDARWTRNMKALEVFVTMHGRFPSQHEKDREDRRLGVWLHSRRQDGDSLPANRRDELNSRVPGWDRTAADKWDKSLQFVANYFVEHGKFPSDHSGDPAIAAAGRWIGTQRRAAALSSRRKDALDARLPGWQDRKDDKWQAMLEFVAAFHSRHARFPASAASSSDEERQAAMWLQRQRHGTGMTPDREVLLSERIPCWRDTADDVWLRNLNECVAFYRKNGRRMRSASADAEERRLAVWLNNTTRSRLSEERAAALAAADLGDLRSREQIWSDTLELVAEFYAAHGRFPAGAGKVPGERPLATWLANHRSDKDSTSQERREAMAARIPGWDLTFDEIWSLKLQDCIGFVYLHGRLPSSGKHSSDSEKKLAGWLMHQRKAKSAERVDRIAVLDEQIPDWRG